MLWKNPEQCRKTKEARSKLLQIAEEQIPPVRAQMGDRGPSAYLMAAGRRWGGRGEDRRLQQ